MILKLNNAKPSMKLEEAKKRVQLSNYFKESVLDTPKETLNPKIWDGMALKPALNDHIKSDVEKYLKDIKIKSIEFVGSNTSFSYNDTSDIDINIIVDVPSQDEADKIFDMLPKGVNLEDTNHPINYHVDTEEVISKKEGRGSSYDILNDKWNVEPSKDDVVIPYTYVVELSKIFMDGIDSRINEYENDSQELEIFEEMAQTATNDKQDIEERIALKKQEVEANLDALVLISGMLWEFRTASYNTGTPTLDLFFNFGKGNKSINNVIYKTLEKFGYKDKLHKYIGIRKEMKNKPTDESVGSVDKKANPDTFVPPINKIPEPKTGDTKDNPVSFKDVLNKELKK